MPNTTSEAPQKTTFSLVRNKKSVFYHPFNFLASAYNNDLELFLKRLSVIFGLNLFNGFIKNRKINTIIKIIQKLITAFFVLSEFYVHVKNYSLAVKEQKTNPYQKRMNKICKILGIKENEPIYEDVPHTSFIQNPDIINWIFNAPKTKRITIKKYINMQNLEELKEPPDLGSNKMWDLAVLFDLKDSEYIWDISLQISLIGTITIHNSTLLGRNILPESDELIFKDILFEYAQKFDFKTNIIKFKDSDFFSTLYAVPRRSINICINQFDAEALLREIDWILENKGRRSYVFVGKQGTGKSTIIRYIEQKLIKYPIIHLSPEDFETAFKIKSRFSLIKMFQPAILAVEDLDSCDLKTKNKVAGAYLDCIDDVNKDLSVVILSTVNDTSRVHHTIINRPGRSDRVIEICAPKSEKEAREVLKSKFVESQKVYCDNIKIDVDFNDILFKKIAEKCVSENFTQAEISNAVVEQALIQIGMSGLKAIQPKVLCDYLDNAIGTQLDTRKAIKNCNFKDLDPIEQNLPLEGASVTEASAYGDYSRGNTTKTFLDSQFKKAGFDIE